MQTLAQLHSGALAGATRLALREGLTEFPEAIYSLADSLEILDLSDNQLTTLPKDLYRLKKLRVIFASNNGFRVLPEVLGQCAALEMIGFKANRIVDVPAGALPTKLRWLILTDNCIQTLPQSIGQLPHLQKLMLAGNQLTHLPKSIQHCQRLQLLRLSANRFEEFPEVILALPQLAWLAFAGNPFAKWLPLDSCIPQVPLDSLDIQHTLGQGASGVISYALCHDAQANLPPAVALKMFKGEVTSDGYPDDELQASVRAGQHANLVEPLAIVSEVQRSGLVMQLIAEGYANLGLPPSLQSCTRDVFSGDACLSAERAQLLIAQMRTVVEHLHEQGICHGDIYAHNTLVNTSGHLLFGDFGAASPLHALTPKQREAVMTIEQRALAAFEEDMLSLVV